MTQLAGAILFVKDLERMQTFYESVLGLQVLEATAGWVRFGPPAGFFALHAIPTAIAAGVAITDPPQIRASSPMKPVFRVEDVTAVRDALLRRAVSMHEPTLSDSGVALRCDGVDPEGNVFQIVC